MHQGTPTIANEPPEPEVVRQKFSPAGFYPNFKLKAVSLCYFKLPSLWQYDMVTLGDTQGSIAKWGWQRKESMNVKTKQ